MGEEIKAQIASLYCEYRNIGWSGPDRCEGRGFCPYCRDKVEEFLK